MSARTPAALNHLRLHVREGMVEWLRENAPDAMCDQA
jgi:hypothetical protein